MRAIAVAASLAAIIVVPVIGQGPEGKPAETKTWAPHRPRQPPGLPGRVDARDPDTFERPPALGTKAFYTEEEAAETAKQTAARRAGPRVPNPGDVGGDNEAFVDTDYTYLRTRQTSLVVDPADGRLPFRPEVEKKREFNNRAATTTRR